MLSLGHSSRRSVPATAGAAVPSGGVMGALGGLAGRNASGGGIAYDAVHNAPAEAPRNLNTGAPQEKSQWLNEQSHGSKKMRWVIVAVVVVLIIGGIVGGVVGGLLSHKKSSSSSGSGSSSNTQTASGDQSSNGDLNSNSPEIQALLNNRISTKSFRALITRQSIPNIPTVSHRHPRRITSLAISLSCLNSRTRFGFMEPTVTRRKCYFIP
jgi:hypothetical protein